MTTTRYALCNCTILDGTKDMQPQPDMTVLVDGETIVSIQSAAIPLPDGFEVVDLDGAFLLPGLINLHSHHFGSGKPSKVLGEGKIQDLVMLFAKTGLGRKYLLSVMKKAVHNHLHSGVTTVRGVGDFRYVDVEVRDLINAGKLEGPRMFVSGPALTVATGHGDGTFAEVGDKPADFRAMVRDRVAHNVDFIKICTTGGVMDSSVPGEAGLPKMSVEQARACVNEAHRLGMKVASHTEGPEGLEVDLIAGVDTVEHGCPIPPDMEALYKLKGVCAVATVSVALPMAKLDPEVTHMPAVTQVNSQLVADRIIQGAKDAVRKHIPLGLGTDAGCPFVTQYDMWREIYHFSKLVEVSPAFALHTATLVNARILGIDKLTGSIEEGKCADLIVVERDPLEDLTALRDVKMVMARGNLIREPHVDRMPEVDAILDTLL